MRFPTWRGRCRYRFRSDTTVLGSSRVVVIVARLREWVDEEAVLGTRRERTNSLRVRGGRYGVQQAHVTNVVDVDLLLENDGEALTVESNSLDCGGEGEFANDRATLRVLDDEVARGEDKCNEGC